MADRHRDLAIASRSVGDHLDPQWADVLVARYGGGSVGTVDASALAFYRLLDEFF